jgi:hypothetical protein
VGIIALIVATGAAALAIDTAKMSWLAIRERATGADELLELPDESDMETYRARMTR